MDKDTQDLKNMKIYIHTFGCQMNENDSERIAGMLIKRGAKISQNLDQSDLIIINTCAVREKPEEKLHSLLGRLKPLKKRKKFFIGVVGCVAQLSHSDLLSRKPYIDFIIGPDNYWQIPHILPSRSGEKVISTQWTRQWKEIPHTETFRKNKVSAYVTIMEGCNNFCSYCVVPFTRGREKFRPIENILREIKDLARIGYKEIQLLGQNVNSYTDPLTGTSFPELLTEVNKSDGIEWIRFITSHPKNFTPDLIKTMKEAERICHQLHLPLQSGSTSVLKRMNRGYTRKEYLELIKDLRNSMPDICLSTDIIVGYPGETEVEFRETLSILESIKYTNIFSFRFSCRPHTSASKLHDDVPFEVKRQRLKEVQNLQKNLQLGMNKSLVGQVMRTLCLGKSKKDPNRYSGRNEGHQVINFKSDQNVIGQFVKVKITGYGPFSLKGEVILEQ